MPHSKPEELPAAGGGRWPVAIDSFRSVQWGDMEVGFTTVQEAMDCTDIYRHLAGGVCQCPHYGYIVRGALRCIYPGTDMSDEVARTGEVYFFPAGHVLIYEEPTTAIEFNPAAALQQLMDGVQRAMVSGVRVTPGVSDEK